MNNSTVTVVIPCYNQGETLEETVASVKQQSYSNVDIVVVNDGSDDQTTLTVLKRLETDGITVVHTTNQGLAAARNNGIAVAKGEYILPLDGDDRIAEHYIEKAMEVFSSQNVGIVYCRAQLFGAVDTEWILPPYSLEQMLLENVIFCSALFRKTDWQEVGGYDTGMLYGWEDYDFWLSLIERGCKVYQIPEILFYYRVTSDSMVRSKEKWQKVAMFKRIFQRHQQLFTDNIEVWINSLLDVHEKYFVSKLYIDSGQGIEEANALSRKITTGSVELEFGLGDYEKIRAMRFDPADVPVVVEFSEICLVHSTEKQSVIEVASDNSIGQDGSIRYFSTNDSNCFFDLPKDQLQNLEKMIIKLRFIGLATDALQQIVAFQQKQIVMSTGTEKGVTGTGVRAVGSLLPEGIKKLIRRV